jgi:hypothetical protein
MISSETQAASQTRGSLDVGRLREGSYRSGFRVLQPQMDFG